MTRPTTDDRLEQAVAAAADRALAAGVITETRSWWPPEYDVARAAGKIDTFYVYLVVRRGGETMGRARPRDRQPWIPYLTLAPGTGADAAWDVCDALRNGTAVIPTAAADGYTTAATIPTDTDPTHPNPTRPQVPR